MTDLLAATAELVDIPSVSHQEAVIAGVVEERLRPLGHLDVERIGDNVVARTHLGRGRRVILGGHTDTVPVNGNDRARLEGDTLWGLGSADMKSGLAVMLAPARDIEEAAVGITYVFFAGAGVAPEVNGLPHPLSAPPPLPQRALALPGP